MQEHGVTVRLIYEILSVNSYAGAAYDIERMPDWFRPDGKRRIICRQKKEAAVCRQ